MWQMPDFTFKRISKVTVSILSVYMLVSAFYPAEGLTIEAVSKKIPHQIKTKVLVSTYYAHNWSSQGRYRIVSKNGKRIGDFVALNFLPGGSKIKIPRLFKNTVFEVADTFGGSGVGRYHGKACWKVDVLRNKGEWYDDVDYPVEMEIVKINFKGELKNASARNNFNRFLREVGIEKGKG